MTKINKVLTTHVGSLPRDKAVVDLLFRRENGEPFSEAEFDEVMSGAVDAVVARQVAIGLDVVSDGETAKIGYATYIKDRLTGFAGDSARQVALDLRPYPEFVGRMAVFAGKQSFKRQSCVGPIEFIGHADLQSDIVRLQAYVEAIGDAMRIEYEAIVGAGLQLQIDCPDLAMARHTGFQNLTEEDFLRRAEYHVEVLNHALRNVPATALRMHLCWGNYEGPHDHDIALEKVLPLVLKAKPAAIQFEASNPRHAHEWVVWQQAKIPEEKILIPGLLTATSNYVDHPELIAQRLLQFADIVGRDRVMAGTDCGFGTFAGIGKMDAEISYKKLAALVRGAELASSRLW
jgi:5-methyltetrahydropteroyltriglutamate--homocysteine methyltransferase